MTKVLIGRTVKAQSTTSNYVRYQTVNPPMAGADINLPPAAVVEALNRVMLAIQQKVKPFITWEVTDHSFDYRITMSWYGRSSQLQLEARVDNAGIVLRLWPDFNHDRFACRPLAAWFARRDVHDGVVNVERVFTPEGTVVLRCSDELFADLPHAVTTGTELIADVVTVVQTELAECGLAPKF